MSNSIVIIICGLPGAGKTTFAKKLETIVPDSIRLSNDELRAQMNLPLIGVNYTKLVYNEAYNRAIEILEANQIPIFDATFFLKNYRIRLYKKLSKYSPIYLFLRIITPFNVCQARIISRGLDCSNGVNNLKVLDYVASTYEEIYKSEIPSQGSIVDIDLINEKIIQHDNYKVVEPILRNIIESILKTFNNE